MSGGPSNWIRGGCPNATAGNDGLMSKEYAAQLDGSTPSEVPFTCGAAPLAANVAVELASDGTVVAASTFNDFNNTMLGVTLAAANPGDSVQIQKFDPLTPVTIATDGSGTGGTGNPIAIGDQLGLAAAGGFASNVTPTNVPLVDGQGFLIAASAVATNDPGSLVDVYLQTYRAPATANVSLAGFGLVGAGGLMSRNDKALTRNGLFFPLPTDCSLFQTLNNTPTIIGTTPTFFPSVNTIVLLEVNVQVFDPATSPLNMAGAAVGYLTARAYYSFRDTPVLITEAANTNLVDARLAGVDLTFATAGVAGIIRVKVTGLNKVLNWKGSGVLTVMPLAA